VTKRNSLPEEVLEFLKKIDSKGGKTRAKKYGAKTLRRWAIESGAGRPRKRKASSLLVPQPTKESSPQGEKKEGDLMKQRGVFEKVPGSGILWICYFDQFGKKRREKAGTKSVAIKLYGKRKQQVLEGKKLPEIFRKPFVNFCQLADDALAYSKRNKRSHKTDVPRFAGLKEWFGGHPAEELTPKEIEHTLGREAEKEKWAPSTFNHYRSLMSLSYRLGILNRKVTANPARSVTHRREDSNRVRFLTEEEKKLRKVIGAKWPLHLPELDLAINTGLRKGSQYGLTWDMVD
jgi:hypothetical protein